MSLFISIAQAAEHAAPEHAPGFFSDPHSWVYITWVIVVAAIARPVFRGVVKGLDDRAAKIKSRLEEAERLRNEAQELLATYQKKQREAQKEAEFIIAQAKSEAERLVAQAGRDLQELLKRREQQALDRITQAEADALNEVRSAAVDIALAATRKLIAENLSAAQSADLIDRQVRDLSARLN